jgi:hypothetical protein
LGLLRLGERRLGDFLLLRFGLLALLERLFRFGLLALLERLLRDFLLGDLDLRLGDFLLLRLELLALLERLLRLGLLRLGDFDLALLERERRLGDCLALLV